MGKLLLLHGRVYPGATTWNHAHRRWLAGQSFEHAPTELAFIATRRVDVAPGPGAETNHHTAAQRPRSTLPT